MTPDVPVLIVGAGVAGLTAALAFAQRDIPVRVIERADSLHETGAGIQLSPNALRVLDRLNVLPALRDAGVVADRVSLRALRSGRSLASVPVRGGDGTPYLSILRADLQRTLMEAVRRNAGVQLDLGVELVGIAHRGSDAIVRTGSKRQGEAEVRAPVLVAADGVRSAVGGALGKASAKASGDVAWRLTLPAADAPVDGITAWLGPSCHAVAYPVDAGRKTNLVVIASQHENDVCRLLTGSDPLLENVARRHFDAATAWPLATANRMRERDDPAGLLFIGDAAHAMLPYAAQGAALAIEDAYVAASCLAAAGDVRTAWRQFESARRPRWEKVGKRVAFHRWMYHLPSPLDLPRNLVLKLRTEASLARELAWLYDWRPPET